MVLNYTTIRRFWQVAFGSLCTNTTNTKHSTFLLFFKSKSRMSTFIITSLVPESVQPRYHSSKTGAVDLLGLTSLGIRLRRIPPTVSYWSYPITRYFLMSFNVYLRIISGYFYFFSLLTELTSNHARPCYHAYTLARSRISFSWS